MACDTTPRITVIIAVYNGAKTLQQCLDSVAQQSHPHVELIVIDGGSKDGTVELLKANEANITYWVSEPDRGIYDAWNKALKKVRGDWVIFMGADDRFSDSQVLSNVANILKPLSSDVMWAYGQVVFMGREGRSLKLGEPWEKVAKRFDIGMAVPHQAVFHRRQLFECLGGFELTYRIAGDYAMLLKTVKKGFLPEYFPLCVSCVGGEGVSSRPQMALRSLIEVSRARRNLGVGPTYPLSWAWDCLKALAKSGLNVLMTEDQLRRLINAYRRLTGRPVL